MKQLKILKRRKRENELGIQAKLEQEQKVPKIVGKEAEEKVSKSATDKRVGIVRTKHRDGIVEKISLLVSIHTT